MYQVLFAQIAINSTFYQNGETWVKTSKKEASLVTNGRPVGYQVSPFDLDEDVEVESKQTESA